MLDTDRVYVIEYYYLPGRNYVLIMKFVMQVQNMFLKCISCRIGWWQDRAILKKISGKPP